MVAKTKPDGWVAQRFGEGASIDVDLVVEAGSWPAERELAAMARQAADGVLAAVAPRSPTASELSIVVSDDTHVRALNAGWRGKDKPTNVLSFPAFPHGRPGALPPLPIGFQTTSTNVVLSWDSTSGATYQLQYKDNLGSGTWLPLGAPVPGTGATLSITNDFTQSSQRFYRLEILP